MATAPATYTSHVPQGPTCGTIHSLQPSNLTYTNATSSFNPPSKKCLKTKAAAQKQANKLAYKHKTEDEAGKMKLSENETLKAKAKADKKTKEEPSKQKHKSTSRRHARYTIDP